MLQLKGIDQLKLFPGRKLEYQPKNGIQAKVEDFISVVEYSAENPYGKAIALFDLKSGLVKVSEDWFVLPAIVLSFIISGLIKKGGPVTVTHLENRKDIPSLEAATVFAAEFTSTALDKNLSFNNEGGDKGNPANAGACGGCGAGGCGSGCGGGGGLGAIVKSGGCGAGCGGGCGGAGGCGVIAKSGGCGGGCGGGGSCGNGLVSAGSAGCGGGGCGGCGAAVNFNGAKGASGEVTPVGA